MKLPVLMSLISGGAVLIITLVLLSIYIWEYFDKNGIKKTVLLIACILLGISVSILYVSMWFINPLVIGIITLVIAFLLFLLFFYLLLFSKPW